MWWHCIHLHKLAEASEDEKIIYLDANNLYGWAMSQKLPYTGFRWMSQTELLELKASPKEFFERLRKEGREDVWCDG